MVFFLCVRRVLCSFPIAKAQRGSCSAENTQRKKKECHLPPMNTKIKKNPPTGPYSLSHKSP